LANIYQSAWCDMPEDLDLHQHHCQSHECHIFWNLKLYVRNTPWREIDILTAFVLLTRTQCTVHNWVSGCHQVHCTSCWKWPGVKMLAEQICDLWCVKTPTLWFFCILNQPNRRMQHRRGLKMCAGEEHKRCVCVCFVCGGVIASSLFAVMNHNWVLRWHVNTAAYVAVIRKCIVSMAHMQKQFWNLGNGMKGQKFLVCLFKNDCCPDFVGHLNNDWTCFSDQYLQRSQEILWFKRYTVLVADCMLNFKPLFGWKWESLSLDRTVSVGWWCIADLTGVFATCGLSTKLHKRRKTEKEVMCIFIFCVEITCICCT
jgi:hypothetical protein